MRKGTPSNLWKTYIVLTDLGVPAESTSHALGSSHVMRRIPSNHEAKAGDNLPPAERLLT